MEFEKIKEIIAAVKDIEEDEIKMESTFVEDLGADSLDVCEIIMEMERVFDLEIKDEDAENIKTVGDAVEQIKRAING